ncbi:calcium-binding protein 39-like [Iris pallida]|uniref:Calcium-binding protein 39-like n=1 Tax=Iris pallida TaxID=29817 RepID=A0AAX6DR21_IRIPA|nr:calcium-binding protein 39-like [Iris pallida]KAJ6808781.1 calcium-binding protein 39-like [Iris pallida]
MSFFFKQSRARSAPSDVVRAVKDSLLALDTKTVPKILEEVEKNIASLRQMLSGDGETEPNQDQVSQIACEICKEDVLSLFVQKLPSLEWDARKDLVHCWAILLRQTIGTNYCCVDYIENHLEMLDFLVVCYNNKEIALNCGNMLRECIKYQPLAKYVLESTSFELFFKYVELPNFDIASDALATFKELLTKHENVVSQYLSAHYEQFFELYEKLLASQNYVTRRQSLKLLSEFLLEPPNAQIMKRYILEVRYLKTMMALLKDKSKNIKISAFHIFKVFVANPHKPHEIIEVLAKNHGELLMLLNNLPTSNGGEDEQLEEEKDLIIKEIERISRLPNAAS